MAEFICDLSLVKKMDYISALFPISEKCGGYEKRLDNKPLKLNKSKGQIVVRNPL